MISFQTASYCMRMISISQRKSKSVGFALFSVWQWATIRAFHHNGFALPCSDFFSLKHDCFCTTSLLMLMLLSLPVKDGLLDWDCAAALVIPDIVTSLDHIRQHGNLPVCARSLFIGRWSTASAGGMKTDICSLISTPKKTETMLASALCLIQ